MLNNSHALSLVQFVPKISAMVDGTFLGWVVREGGWVVHVYHPIRFFLQNLFLMEEKLLRKPIPGFSRFFATL